MNDLLRNILLGITCTVTIVAILEAAGVLEVIDKDTYQIAGYCDNTNRDLAGGETGGGSGIAADEARDLMEKTFQVISENKLKINYEYFLSKVALDSLFNDKRASGIFIAPVFESNDSLNLIVGKSYARNTLTEPAQGYAFVIKTFCPTTCEVIARTAPLIDAGDAP